MSLALVWEEGETVVDVSIPEEYQRLRGTLRKFAEREVIPALKEAGRDEYGEPSIEVETKLRRRSTIV